MHPAYFMRGLVVYGNIEVFLLRSSPLLSAFSIYFDLEAFPLRDTLANTGEPRHPTLLSLQSRKASLRVIGRRDWLANSFSPDDSISLPYRRKKYHFGFRTSS